jgi:cytochrome b561
MGTDVLVLILPAFILVCPLLWVRLKKESSLSTKRAGPLLSSEALEQLTLHLVIYFIMFLMPIAGKMTGELGQSLSLLLMFLIIISLMVRFKKLGND